MRAVWLLLLVPALALGACAIPEPPPGGPEDKTPPEVVSTFPEDRMGGVPVDTEIRITFGEKMSRTKLERSIVFYPHTKIARGKWRGDTFVVTPEGGLHPDTTYVVEVKAGFADVHGVRSPAGHRFGFATSELPDSGVIAGRVFFRRKASSKAIVRLYALPRDTAFAPEAARPDRETPAGEEGKFRFDYLPTDLKAFSLWAFEDENANGAFEREREAGAALSDTLRLTAGGAVIEGLEIFIVDPKEPASVAGSIANETEIDTLPVSVSLDAVADTTGRRRYYTRCDPKGQYEFRSVLGGAYTLVAFIDFRPDSACGDFPCPEDTTAECGEPCAMYPDTLRIQPGDRVKLKELGLTRTAWRRRE